MKPLNLVATSILVIMGLSSLASAQSVSKYQELDTLFNSSEAMAPTKDSIVLGEFKSLCYLAAEPDKKVETTWSVKTEVVDHGPLLGKETVASVAFRNQWSDVKYADGYAVAYYYPDDGSSWMWDIRVYDDLYIIETTIEGKDYDFCYAFKE